MSIENHTSAPGANIHEEHYCNHVSVDGQKCAKWGCYGFQESKIKMNWYCAEHQPEDYRGLAAFPQRQR